MTELPDDTIAIYLAVRRPCLLDKCDVVPLESSCPWLPCGFDCQGDGTRIVLTEIEVEGPQNGWETYGWDDPEGASIRCRKDGYFPVKKV